MASTPEPLSGGLVTARDPSLLEAGELTQADDLMYIPGSPSLHRCFGKELLSTTGLTAPKGIAYCGFDSARDQLALLAAGALYHLPADGTGAVTFMRNQGGSTLDAVHYNDRHYLLTGAENRVLLGNGAHRAHGLLPVASPPGLVHSAIGGAFPVAVPGVYTYWTTEVYIDATTGETIESTNNGAVAAISVTATTSTVTISRPPQINPGATHWRVYRSALGGGYPVGYRIAERLMSSTDPNVPADTVIDGASQNTGFLFPVNVSSILDNNVIRYILHADGNLPVCANSWTNPGNVTADDAANAVWNATSCPAGSLPIAALEMSGFAFAGAVRDPVQKIEIEVQAQSLALDANAIQFSFSGDAGGNIYHRTATVGIGTALTTNVATIHSDPAFPMHASMFGTGFRLYAHTWRFSQIDYIKINVYHAGTTADVSTLFDAIQIRVGGQSVITGANGPPPSATTGDIFQESLVLNDVANPSRIAYSMAGNPEAFPSPYILNLQTKDKDRLTCIRTIGSVCVFGLSSQVWRANYLPREEDAEFDRGRCTEVIDADNGILGPFGATKFVLGGRLSLFYLSRSGPRMTDGFGCETANEDLDWPNTVDLAQLGSAVVVNNADNQEILVYYIPTGGTTLSKCLRFQYHATHLKNGKLKAIGPCAVEVVAATTGIAGDGERVLYTLSPNAIVYQENRGFAGAEPRFSTRDMYHGGAGGEWELHRVLLHTQGMEATLGAIYTITRSNNPERQTSIRNFNAPRRGFSLLTPSEGGEGLKVTINAADVDEEQVFDYLVMEGDFVSPATPLSA